MTRGKLNKIEFPITGTIKRTREDVTLLGIESVAGLPCFRVKQPKLGEVTYHVDAVIARTP